MTTIYLNNEHVEIRAVSANVKGTRAVVKVELVVIGSHELGYLLDALERAKADIKRQHAEKAASAKRTKGQRALEHQQLLAIPYFGDRS